MVCLHQNSSQGKRLTKWQEKPLCPLKPACRRQGGFKEKQLLVIELLVIWLFGYWLLVIWYMAK